MKPCKHCHVTPTIDEVINHSPPLRQYQICCWNWDCTERPETIYYKTKKPAIIDWEGMN